jgi:hypothetical protein
VPEGSGRKRDGPAVAIEVTTEPADSSVREADVELCRATPCGIVYEGAEASPDAVHVLTVARDGYRTETKTIRPTDGPLVIALAPMPIKRRAPTPGVSRSRAPPLPPPFRLDVY